ncbi:hypothetical protein L3Q82_004197 [Scortum barcoo]|uniref:Uncharacterized protein n=1 Tax=Scortum barcoo TaxID=214431 RepID=A0ACB8VK16_9TELE|nr:hypothetical protein L3Q82_004197 [Scortum barcoo]
MCVCVCVCKDAVFVQEFADTTEEERLRGRVRELEEQVSQLRLSLAVDQQQREEFIQQSSRNSQWLLSLRHDLTDSLDAVTRRPIPSILESETQRLDLVCWGGGCSERDKKRLNRLIKRASSVCGCPLDSIEVMGERRALAKLSTIMDNTSHPLHQTVGALSSSFSNRLRHPRCRKELPQGLPPGGTCLEHLPREVRRPGGIRNRCPGHLS